MKWRNLDRGREGEDYLQRCIRCRSSGHSNREVQQDQCYQRYLDVLRCLEFQVSREGPDFLSDLLQEALSGIRHWALTSASQNPVELHTRSMFGFLPHKIQVLAFSSPHPSQMSLAVTAMLLQWISFVKSIDQSAINSEQTLTFFKVYQPAVLLKSIWKHFSLTQILFQYLLDILDRNQRNQKQIKMCAEVIKSLQACVFFDRGYLIMETPVVCAIGRPFELK